MNDLEVYDIETHKCCMSELSDIFLCSHLDSDKDKQIPVNQRVTSIGFSWANFYGIPEFSFLNEGGICLGKIHPMLDEVRVLKNDVVSIVSKKLENMSLNYVKSLLMEKEDLCYVGERKIGISHKDASVQYSIHFFNKIKDFFNQSVLNNDNVVIFYFYRSWCVNGLPIKDQFGIEE